MIARLAMIVALVGCDTFALDQTPDNQIADVRVIAVQSTPNFDANAVFVGVNLQVIFANPTGTPIHARAFICGDKGSEHTEAKMTQVEDACAGTAREIVLANGDASDLPGELVLNSSDDRYEPAAAPAANVFSAVVNDPGTLTSAPLFVAGAYGSATAYGTVGIVNEEGVLGPEEGMVGLSLFDTRGEPVTTLQRNGTYAVSVTWNPDDLQLVYEGEVHWYCAPACASLTPNTQQQSSNGATLQLAQPASQDSVVLYAVTQDQAFYSQRFMLGP